MKVKFSKATTYVPEWKGNKDLPEDQQIKVTLEPITFGDLMSLMDAFSKFGIVQEGATSVDTSKVDTKAISLLLTECSDLLPKYATVTGLVTDEGTELAVEDIVQYAFFLQLALEILMALTQAGTPSEEEVKN